MFAGNDNDVACPHCRKTFTPLPLSGGRVPWLQVPTLSAVRSDAAAPSVAFRSTVTHAGTGRKPAEIPETGRKLDFRFVAVFRFDESKMSSIYISYDQVGLSAG